LIYVLYVYTINVLVLKAATKPINEVLDCDFLISPDTKVHVSKGTNSLCQRIRGEIILVVHLAVTMTPQIDAQALAVDHAGHLRLWWGL